MLNLKKNLTMLLLMVCLGVVMGSCANDEPIKVGFSGELTGALGAWGVAVRNGVQLAVEDINADGGINGRRVELLIKDDKGLPNIAREVDQSLIEQGVVAIIGHVTSSQTAAAWEQTNEAKMVLLSPTASSTQFSNQKDYFFRMPSSTDWVGSNFAKYAYNSLGLRRMSGVYDLDNEAYNRFFWEAFAAEFEALGGEIERTFPYNSSKTDLAIFVEQIVAADPSALLFVASDLDTAFLSQHVMLQGKNKIRLLSASGAHTERFLAKGGAAVEGIVFPAEYDENNPNPAFQVFTQQYKERFGSKPHFGSVYGHEAMELLAEALKETGGEAKGLSEALLNIKNFPVLQESISMNEYGDVERDVYINVVENGQFKLIDTISSREHQHE